MQFFNEISAKEKNEKRESYFSKHLLYGPVAFGL